MSATVHLPVAATQNEAPATKPLTRTTVIVGVLVALSCVPSVALPSHLATKLTLVVLHLTAVAIIVPVLARQLDS